MNNTATSESPVISRYWPKLKGLSDNLKLELIILLSRSISLPDEIEEDEKNDDDHWADRFVGKWQDDRTAEGIVDDIRSMRTDNSFDIEL